MTGKTMPPAVSSRKGRTVLLVAGVAGLLVACDGSARFGEFGGPGRGAVTPPPRQQTFTPAPSPPLTSQPLPPLASPGNGAVSPGLPGPGPVAANPSLPPAGSSLPIDPPRVEPDDFGAPPPPRGTNRVGEPPQLPQVAARPEPQTPAAPAGPPTRTSVTGNWNAREATGGSCRVLLSGTPTLDLYKASSTGCQAREMQRISAWELRGDEVYLYETGGAIAARLRKSGAGFGGALSKSGAPLTLSK